MIRFGWKLCITKKKITFLPKIVIFKNENADYVECNLLSGPNGPTQYNEFIDRTVKIKIK